MKWLATPRSRAVLLAALLLSIPRPATADTLPDEPDPRALWGPAAGALTAMVPLAVAGAFLAQDRDPAFQRTGITIMCSGLAAAPWVAHAVTGRWKRAAVFGLLSAGLSAATLWSVQNKDPFNPHLDNSERLMFGILLTSAFVGSAVGIIDSYLTSSTPRQTR